LIATIRRSLWLGLVCGSLVALSASPPVIGVAQSRGAFFVNNASVPGTATILDGTSVRTTLASSDVSLRTGERLTLASSSSATVYRDRLVLQTGMAELNHLSTYRLETRNLRIGASGTGAQVRVGLDSGDQVKVVAVAGIAEVFNPQGMLVARVLPGTALQLKATAATNSKLTGTVQTQDGKFFLTDETSKVKVELRGSNLKKLVGKHVQVTGSAASGEKPAGDASQVIVVASATVVAAAVAGGAAAGGAAAAGAAAGAGVATGVSAATIAVVGGVAAGATVGGLGVAGTFSSGSTVSR
jgi:hypothetical protein